MMNYYIGVDIGTTATKVVAFSSTGEVLAHDAGSYKMLHPQAGWSEQQPGDIVKAVIDGISKIYHQLMPAKPVLVSFSAPMHSLILVDDNGKPLTNCIIWADNRAVSIAESLKKTAQGKKMYENTGVPIHAMSPLCKLLWLKQHNPALFEQAFKFIGIKEYVFLQLFGVYMVDTSIASATGLLNTKTLQWDHDILDMLSITPAKLSDVVSVKHAVTFKPGANLPEGALPLPTQTAFITGGSDGASANISIGDPGERSMVITIGTSAAARILSEQPGTDALMRTFCYHAKDNSYIIGGAANNGAVALDWLKESWLQTNESVGELLDLAKTAAPGCDGLIFLPYLLGERAPLWDAHAKAVFFGLTINHTKAHMVRAVMEAIIYNTYSIGKVIMEKNEVNEIYATGGFTRNGLWLQILADVFNRQIILCASEESSALGAVITGMEAMQITFTSSRSVISTYQPDIYTHHIYMKNFSRFERLYPLLRAEFE
jgi:gluconokinase